MIRINNEDRPDLVKLNVGIADAQLDALRAESLLSGRPISWLIRRAVQTLLDDLKKESHA